MKKHPVATVLVLASCLGALYLGILTMAGGALGLAVERGDQEGVQKALSEKGYPATELNPHLYQALKNGDLEIAQSLIVAGADVNYAGGEHSTPLISSAFIFFPKDAAMLLLEQKPEPNTKDSFGRCPAVLLLLYRKGNFPEVTEDELLTFLKKLKENGADLTLPADDGSTVSSLAEGRGFSSISEFLNRP